MEAGTPSTSTSPPEASCFLPGLHGILFFASFHGGGRTHSLIKAFRQKPLLYPPGEGKIKDPLSWSDHRASPWTPKELHLLDRLQMYGAFNLHLALLLPLPSTPSARDPLLLALRSSPDKGPGRESAALLGQLLCGGTCLRVGPAGKPVWKVSPLTI